MKQWSLLMWFYLLMSAAGAIVPWYFNLNQIANGIEPFTLLNYFRAGFENNFAASITADFFIGTTPVVIWMVMEGRRLKMKGIWAYILFTFVIAFAFTCPLFLFNRQRILSS
jgi:hypothetical protein